MTDQPDTRAMPSEHPIARLIREASDRIPLTRPVPSRTDRLTDARRCHTTDQHHHTDGLEADLRSLERANRELTAELEQTRGELDEWISRRPTPHLNAVRADRDRYRAENDRLRDELGRAQDYIAAIADLDEQRDRARAAYDTRQERDAVTITLDNSTGTFTPTPGSPADHAQDQPAKPRTIADGKPFRWDPAENCYCGGPEQTHPHRYGTGRHCNADARP